VTQRSREGCWWFSISGWAGPVRGEGEGEKRRALGWALARNKKRERKEKGRAGRGGLGQQAENRAREGEKRNSFSFYFSEFSNYFQTEF
jgi:hypothetical protein